MIRKTIFLLFVSFVAFSQTEDSLLTIDRIFNSMEFIGEYPPQMIWQENEPYYTSVENSKDVPGGRDIVIVDPETGEKEIMVAAKDLIPEGSEKPLKFQSYSWSKNQKWLLFFTNTKRVWRRNTRGDYWVLNTETKKLTQIGKDLPVSSLMFAKFSPDENYIAYVSKNNIYVEDLNNFTRKQLTFDGSKTIINGTFDWVYEEELGLRDGFRWSPDGKKIAYWQLDASGIGEYLMLNTTDSIYSKTINVQYPKAGTKNSACKVGVVDIASKNTVWMKVPGDPRNNYIARMDWAESNDEIYIQYLNRLQNNLDVMLCNVNSGDVKTILTEKDEAWIDINDDMTWFESGKKFLWVSERDGWKHLYLVSRDGGKIELITKGEYDVINIVKIDEENNWIYFIASPDNATQRYLYRISIEENGKLEKITPEDQKGSHSYRISSDAKYAIHSYTNFTFPRVTDIVELPSHKSIRKITDNKKLLEKISKIKTGKTEFFRIKTEDNVELDGWKIYPAEFDPNKKYPLLFYVYSEPGSQTVLDRFSYNYLWYQMLAQKGYIIVSIDSRGTPAPRGRDWRKSIYRKIGVITSNDQAKAARAIIRDWKYVDENRIGIWGWSGGGSMTLNMMFRYPEIYKMGMSVAPVTDLKLYDTIYEERYMGLPQENKEDYKNGSPVTFAKNLKGKLLLIHGTGDDNVHYQNTEVLINELIKHNKQFSMFAYPNRSHGIYEGYNTRRHLFTMLTNFLLENLEPGAK